MPTSGNLLPSLPTGHLSNLPASDEPSRIESAQINWQADDNGIQVPVSSVFGDVYFSKVDGLAESRYVFLEGNDLARRWAKLGEFERFVVGEIGFGTGLNVLAIWQLWQTIRPANHSHLHIITTEKFPLAKADLIKALRVWDELEPFLTRLIDNYPPPLPGCHRLNFFDARLSIDIWLGDAADSLTQVIGKAYVDAWLLDGFAPSCNNELWSDKLFSQIRRLSRDGTTLATFSVASSVKTGLTRHSFLLKKRQGFGKKREMLTATFDSTHPSEILSFKALTFYYLSLQYLSKRLGQTYNCPPFAPFFYLKRRFSPKFPRAVKPKALPDFALPTLPSITSTLNILIVGAGVAGLSVAYALAIRGHQVTVIDKTAPLSGASGNVRAVLAPKLTNLARLPTNLHTIGFLASCRFYPALSLQTGLEILQKTGCLDLLAHSRITAEDVQQFPPEFANLLSTAHAQVHSGIGVGEAIFIPDAGLIDTAKFAKAVLTHPNILYQQATLQTLAQIGTQVTATISNTPPTAFDHVVLCMALDTCDFLPNVRPFNYSRGQVSWFELPNDSASQFLPKLPLKYGSYFASFEQSDAHYAMLGASFVRDTLDTTPRLADHRINVADLAQAVPDLITKHTNVFDPNTNWQGRASLRSQTVDYLPLVGQVWQDNHTTTSRIWTFSALGSKGYAYAPICSELLAGLMCGELLPLAKPMVEKLSPNRKVLRSDK